MKITWHNCAVILFDFSSNFYSFNKHKSSHVFADFAFDFRNILCENFLMGTTEASQLTEQQ